jgi:hypothetical protein
MSAMGDLVNYLKGQLASVGVSPLLTQAAGATALQKHRITVMKPATTISGDDSGIAVDITETPIFVNLTGTTITVTGMKYASGATGMTGLDANAPSLNLFSRTSTGASQLAVAVMTFGTAVGAITTGQQVTGTLSATVANRTVPVGGVLTLSRTHAGAGIVIPGGTITIEYTED